MAFAVTNSGVDFSRGRGKAKVTLSISFRELEAWAKRMQLDIPKLTKQSFARACSGLKKKFYQVVNEHGGVCGVPKFADFESFTRELRAVKGRTSPMGGVLSEYSSIVAYKRGGSQFIGWKDYLKDVANLFQDGEPYGGDDPFATAKQRQNWHRQGIREVPRAYARNPRRVLPEPFGAFVNEHLIEWAKGAYYKDLAKKMMKARAAA